MDHRFLRQSKPLALAKYLRDALQKYDNQSISDELLAGISSESLPPTVAYVWIGGFADANSLLTALRFEDSALVRKIAIRKFGSSLRTRFTVWDAAGGTQGLLRLFAESSVKDVANLCKAIGRSSTYTFRQQERQERVTELLKALASEYFPGAAFTNPDSRPLVALYSKMLPACTPNLAKVWLDHDILQRYANTYRLCEAHPFEFQQLYIQNVGKKDGRHMYSVLLSSIPEITVTAHLSGSMRFSLDVLQALNSKKEHDVGAEYILNTVTFPLLRRLERRRTTSQLRADIIKMALRLLQRLQNGYRALSLSSANLIGFSIRLWKRNPEKFAHVLNSVARASTYSRPSIMRQFTSLLKIVSCRTRYKLLRILMQQVLSIDPEEHEDLQSFGSQWPVDLLLSLPSTHARVLLDRLIRLKPSGDFLDWKISAPSKNSIFFFADLSILEVYLSRGEIGQLQKAEKVIERYKKVSTTAREQTERALWAKAALFCAIASGSLELYQATLIWSRRYNKDALSLKELYGSSVILTDEGVDLLCGIPIRPNDILAEQVKASVEDGNTIILLLLETACQVLREPHFHLPDWYSVLDLFSVVVAARIRRSSTLQDTLNLNTERLFHILWRDTLRMLLNAEQVGLKEAHEKLHFNTLQGPLRYIDLSANSVSLRISTCRFFDSLARERDELWTKFRRSVNPIVTTLREPWTKGLPIQACIPPGISFFDIGQHAPFLFSLSRRIVFLNPQAASDRQPGDQETLDAIGQFVDSYKLALRLYVSSYAGTDWEVQTQKAWDHAYNKLTGDRMSRLEAIEFWKDVFTDADVNPPQVDRNLPTRPELTLPYADDPSEPMLWSPDPDYEHWSATSRNLNPSCLDCLLQRPGETGVDIHSPYRPLESSVVHVAKQIPAWDKLLKLHSSTLSPQTREALIALSLLYINSKKSTGFRLLAQPFPSTEQVRFPAIYLDDDFIDRKDLERNLGETILSKIREYAPSSLLANLCHGMIKPNVKPEGVSNFEGDIVGLIKILARSDKPQRAMELIQHMIAERPEDSSWHRHLLNNGWLEKLSAKQVKDFLRGLTARILQKLKEHAERKRITNEQLTESSGPVIKVSTLKMLAQLMFEAQFIGPDLNVDILIGLFKNSVHLDVRLAIIESLTTSLQKPSADGLKTRIIDALRMYAVPVAGDVNERSTLTDEAWETAENEANLPELLEPKSSHSSPIFEALVRSSKNVAADVTEQMVNDILLPAVTLSIENNRRWMQLFLQTQATSGLNIDALPAVPVKPGMLRLLFDAHLKLLPSSLYDSWVEATLINLQPSQPLNRLNQAITDSSTARSSNAEQHWLMLWGNTGLNALNWGGRLMTDYLNSDFTSLVARGISHEQIQKSAIRLADVLIRGGEETLDLQDYFFEKFRTPTRNTPEGWENWQLNSKPVIEFIISKIESLRTLNWQRDQNRKPTMLKDTYEMKLWLLPYRAEQNDTNALDVFAGDILQEIKSMANMKGPYHTKFNILKKAALRHWPSEFCYIACSLGFLDEATMSDPMLVEYLQIEIADSLLREASYPTKGIIADDARKLLKSWRESPCEDFRMIGLHKTQLLRKRGSASWFNQD